VQSAFDQPGRELCLAVLQVVKFGDIGCGDHDERRVAAECLFEAHPMQLVAQIAWADRGRRVRPAVQARRESVDLMDGDVVPQVNSPQCCLQAGAQQAARQGSRRVHAALTAAPEHRLLYGGCRLRWRDRGRRARPGRPEDILISCPLRCGDKRELHRCRVDHASDRWAGRLDGRRAVSEREDRYRQLVHTVGSHQRRDRRREPGIQPRRDPGRSRGCERLREHRARIPVDVAVATLAVPPPGAPRNAGHDDRRRPRPRRWPDSHERVLVRVVPVHAGW
jgi:hypothetical protein